MILFLYDKTLDGLLTALFEAYRRRLFPDRLSREGEPLPLFHEAAVTVRSDARKARRVWEAARGKIDAPALVAAWVSGEEGVDLLLFRYIRKALDAPASIALNFADPDVLELSRLSRRVAREKTRMVQFLRFQKAADGTFLAAVEPLYDLLPAIVAHLEERFAGQKWLVYDLKRGYGLYHDLHRVAGARLDERVARLLARRLDAGLLDAEERQFQALWRSYINAITVRERLNPSLQRRNMPARFWKYLAEKQ